MTKKCVNCNWILPIWRIGRCPVCYRDCDVLGSTVARDNRYKRRLLAKEMYSKWLIESKDFKKTLLTETEWLMTCKVFKGCAICHGHIEIREFVIPYVNGGKYIQGNIIPLCIKCTNTYNKITKYGIFINLLLKCSDKDLHKYVKKLNKITYLLKKLEGQK